MCAVRTLAVKGVQGLRQRGQVHAASPAHVLALYPTPLPRAGLVQLQAAAAHSNAVLGQWAATCCRGLVAALGGAYSSQVDDTTTHLLVVQPDAPSCSGGSSPAASDSSSGGGGSSSSSALPATAGVQPAMLLEAVSMQCGGPAAVMALQRRLQAGALLVLPHRWAGVAGRTLRSEAEQLSRAFHSCIAILRCRRLSALCCCVAVRLNSRASAGLDACRRLQDLAAVVQDLCTGVPPPALEGGVGLAMAAGCDDWAAWPWERFAAELDRQKAVNAAAAAATAAATAGTQPVAAPTAAKVETAQDGGTVATQAAAQQAWAQGRGPAARGKASGGQRAAAAGRRGAATAGSSPEAEMALPAKPSGPLGQLGQAARRAAVADLLAELPSQLPASQPTAAADYAWPASQPAASAARALGSRRGGRAVRSQPFARGTDAEAGFGAFTASQPVGLAELAARAPPPPARVQSKPEEPAGPAALGQSGRVAPAAAQPVGRPEVVNLAGSSEDEGPSQPAAKRCRSGSPPAAAAPHPGPPTLAACEAPAAISGLGGRGGNGPAPPAPPSMFAVLCSRWNLSSAAGTAGTAGTAAAGAAGRAGTAALGTAGAAAAAGGSSGRLSAVVKASQPAPPAAPPAAPPVAATAARRPPLPGGTTLALLLGLPTNDPSASGAGQPAPAAAHPPAASRPPGGRQAPAGVEAATAPADSQCSQGSGAAEDAGEEAAWAGRRNRISRMRAQFQASQEGSQLYYLD